MALAAVSRVRQGSAKEGAATSEHRDNDLPSYLLEFPAESSRIKDLQLSVLLGRYSSVEFISPSQSHCHNVLFRIKVCDIFFPYAERGKHADL